MRRGHATAVLLTLVAGCGGSSGKSDGGPDGSMDAMTDAPAVDAGDAGEDAASPDASADAAEDGSSGDAGGWPGPGPGPDCPALPNRDCEGSEAYCSELVVFDPRTTAYYDDYAINGETEDNQYRSYLRRDLRMLIEYATAKTLCKTSDWDTGIGGPLGLGDMSEEDGAIPGTSVGHPDHPEGVHVDGKDIDLAYYQKGTEDNRLRAICEHEEDGSDARHCTAEPHLLDAWRTALFIGFVAESPKLRLVIVDGRAGPPIEDALETLCTRGWLPETSCDSIPLAWEESDTGAGYYWFFHYRILVRLDVD